MITDYGWFSGFTEGLPVHPRAASRPEPRRQAQCAALLHRPDFVRRIESLEAEIEHLAPPALTTSFTSGSVAVSSLNPTEPPRRSS
jgi:hypothetical protein